MFERRPFLHRRTRYSPPRVLRQSVRCPETCLLSEVSAAGSMPSSTPRAPTGIARWRCSRPGRVRRPRTMGGFRAGWRKSHPAGGDPAGSGGRPAGFQLGILQRYRPEHVDDQQGGRSGGVRCARRNPPEHQQPSSMVSALGPSIGPRIIRPTAPGWALSCRAQLQRESFHFFRAMAWRGPRRAHGRPIRAALDNRLTTADLSGK